MTGWSKAGPPRASPLEKARSVLDVVQQLRPPRPMEQYLLGLLLVRIPNCREVTEDIGKAASSTEPPAPARMPDQDL